LRLCREARSRISRSVKSGERAIIEPESGNSAAHAFPNREGGAMRRIRHSDGTFDRVGWSPLGSPRDRETPTSVEVCRASRPRAEPKCALGAPKALSVPTNDICCHGVWMKLLNETSRSVEGIDRTWVIAIGVRKRGIAGQHG
jgi:hypothetical protein